MYKRALFEKVKSSTKSLLLLGPRQTGKSTLIRETSPDLSINLSSERTFLDYSSRVDLLEKTLATERPKTVFIDEVQRIPSLLNTIQALLDEHPKKYRFLLTGSSARKLRRGNANLLPGRIVSYQLRPLSVSELGDDFDLDDALVYGTLPGIVTEKSHSIRREILRTYSATYLKEEIQAEALTKQIEGFARFLAVAASKSGQFLDFAKMGTLAAINQKTSSRFFEILEDTLIVSRIEAFASDETQRLVRHPKFYFFDSGVLSGLFKNFTLSEDRRGFLFEHFVVNQIVTANFAAGDAARLSTYRTEAGSEVDLIVEKDGLRLAIEIKSSDRIGSHDLSGVQRFLNKYPKKTRGLVLYAGSRAYRENAVSVLPWAKGLKEVSDFLT